MAFNSHTYHANKHQRAAAEELAEARDIKARAARGEAYDWEISHIPNLARRAILSARISRTYRALAAMQKGARA